MAKPNHFLLLGLLFLSLHSWAKPAYKVVCEKADECPEWVAGLAHEKGVCSSFLVAPNIIGTNLHCIPDDLRKEKVSCKDRIVVSFPKTGRFPEETFDCDEMVHVSPPISDKTLTPDFAFFRLKEKTTREYLEISQAGIADGARITIYKVDPGAIGTVRKVVCPAVQNSLFNPYFQQDKSPLVSLIPCPIIKGNSGSALVGTDGKAHGIIFSVYDVRIPMDPTLAGSQATGVASNGANFSCLNTFFLNYVQGEPEACLISIDEASQNRFFKNIIETRSQKFQKEINDKLKALLQEKVQAHQGRYFWNLSSNPPSIEEGQKGIVMKASIEAKCQFPQPAKAPAAVSSAAAAPSTTASAVPGTAAVATASTVSVPSGATAGPEPVLEKENFKVFYGTDEVMRPQYRLESEKVPLSPDQAKLPICQIN